MEGRGARDPAARRLPLGARPVAEARFLAARLRRLVDDHDVASAATSSSCCAPTPTSPRSRRSWSAPGFAPTWSAGAATGRSSRSTTCVRLLGTIANPLDDECLFGVLASPACAVRPGHAVAPAAGRRRRPPPVAGDRAPLRTRRARRDADGRALPGRDPRRRRRRASRALRTLAGAAGRGRRLALDELIERAVTALGYDLATLMMDRGTRRYANVRKLMRLARGIEAAEGRDLRGFLDFVAESAGARSRGRGRDRGGGSRRGPGDDRPRREGARVPGRRRRRPGPRPARGRRAAPVRSPTSTRTRRGDDADRLRRGSESASPASGATAVGVFGYDEMLDAAADATRPPRPAGSPTSPRRGPRTT